MSAVVLTAAPVAPPATTSVPGPGDPLTSAGVQAYMQSTINSVEFIRQRVPGANLVGTPVLIPYSLGLAAQSSAGWARADFAPSGGGVITSYSNSTLANALYIPINGLLFANGMKIVSLNVPFAGATGHGALPAVMPQIELVKQDRGIAGLPASIPAPVSINTQIDGVGSVPAFQNVHFISLTLGAPELFDSSQLYSIRVTAESGANALTGARLFDNGYLVVSA